MKKLNPISFLLIIICSLFFFILGAGIAALTEFDTVFGDFATWIASIGTVSTLGYAIFQNNLLRQEQKSERKEREKQEARQQVELQRERELREAHEREQQKMWNQQNQMFTFQKYEAHSQLLNQLFDKIECEPRFRGIYIFPERTRAYARLFPNNNLTNCEVDFSSPSNNYSPLQTIESIMSDIVEHANILSSDTGDKQDSLMKFVANLNLWAETLGSKIKETNLPGTFGIGNIKTNCFFNISRGLSCIFALCDITDELRRFSNIEPIPKSSRDSFHIFLKEELYINLFLLTDGDRVFVANSGALNSLTMFSKVYITLQKYPFSIKRSIQNELPYFYPDISGEMLTQFSDEAYIVNEYKRIVAKLHSILHDLEEPDNEPINELLVELEKQLRLAESSQDDHLE